MENVADKLFVQKKLKPFFISYVIALAVFLLLLSSAVLCTRYATSLDETLGKFQIVKVNLAKIRNVTGDVKATLIDAAKLISPGVSKESSATHMYMGLDALRSRVGKAQITAAAIEDKGSELAMPVTITGPIVDYPAFLNSVGSLQSMRFPFFAVTNLIMTRNIAGDGGAPFSFEIRGVLSTPKIEPNAGQAGPLRRSN
jgi:hypothetical protein